MVPGYFDCDRNLVTSWTGVASQYSRSEQALSLVVATDADTVESIRFEYESADELLARLYIRGRRFTESDWNAIEVSRGTLIEGVRLTVWLCEDKATAAVIDWQPPPQ